ncbi:hypothetical protein CERSUDRAFT_81414 [Gelatoporia subvermispora B]|uniref:NmrA-like domain-containing protein n=1 Tax=Ceriporiopsis subvermispora (strain B) TaxID=914234 RepID=M2RNU6_CERS8|nr:hypothetical protein CERSUDRAFT_81414 [Gelatoporia subvermispora B]
MAPHEELLAPLNVVALFGATGMLGNAILSALLKSPRLGYEPEVVVFLRPGKDLDDTRLDPHPRLRVVHNDYMQKGPELAKALNGIDAVVSALSGPAVAAQYHIFNSAINAGVRRFYPSEFGFHHPYSAPGDPGARILPLWFEKEQFTTHAKLHPAVEEGKIAYTFIGAGDLYNQPQEPFWCPWVQDRDLYQVPVVGNPDALVDWSNIDDIARYTVATLSKPELSINATLNFPSETMSQKTMVDLFARYAKGREVTVRHFSSNDAHHFAARPEEAPKEIAENSLIPVDFFFVVKCIQGSGTFRRSRWECHWDLFPEVQRTTFEEYLKERFPE